jgi:hypothetical protein
MFTANPQQTAKDLAAHLANQQKLYSLAFLFDFTALRKSALYIWISLIVSALACFAWYFCCFQFDVTVTKNTPRQRKYSGVETSSSSDDDDGENRKSKKNKKSDHIMMNKNREIHGLTIIGRLRSEKNNKNNNNKSSTTIMENFISKITSPGGIFFFCNLAIWPAWIAFVMQTVLGFHAMMSSNTREVIFEVILLICTQTLFGVCSVIYVIKEDLSVGILLQLLLIGAGILKFYYESSKAIDFEKITIHPYCLHLNFISILASIWVLMIFVLIFMQTEMRKALTDFGNPKLVEILDAALPAWIFPRETKSKTNQKNEVLIQEMIRRRKQN